MRLNHGVFVQTNPTIQIRPSTTQTTKPAVKVVDSAMECAYLQHRNTVSHFHLSVLQTAAQIFALHNNMSGDPGPSNRSGVGKDQDQAPSQRQKSGSVVSMLEAAFAEASSEGAVPSPGGKEKSRAYSFDELYDLTPPRSPSKNSKALKKTKKTRPETYDESLFEIERALLDHAVEGQQHQREQGRQRTLDPEIPRSYEAALRIRGAKIDRVNEKRRYEKIGQDPSDSSGDDGNNEGGNAGDFGGGSVGGQGGAGKQAGNAGGFGGSGQSANKSSTMAKYLADFDKGNFRSNLVDDFGRPVPEDSWLPVQGDRLREGTPSSVVSDTPYNRRVVRVPSHKTGVTFPPTKRIDPLPGHSNQTENEKLSKERRQRRVEAMRAIAKERADASSAALADLEDLNDLNKDEKRWVDKVIKFAEAPVSKDKEKAGDAFRILQRELARMPDPIKDQNPGWYQYLDNMRNGDSRAGSKSLDDILHGKWAEKEADLVGSLVSLRPSKILKPKALSGPSRRNPEASKPATDAYWSSLGGQVIRQTAPEWHKEQQGKAAKGELLPIATEKKLAKMKALSKELRESDWMKDLMWNAADYHAKMGKAEVWKLKNQTAKQEALADIGSQYSMLATRPATKVPVNQPISPMPKPASIEPSTKSAALPPANPRGGLSREEHAAAETKRRADSQRLVNDTGFDAQESFRARSKHARALRAQEMEAEMPPSPPAAPAQAGAERRSLTASGNPIYVDFVVKIMLMRGLTKIKCEADEDAPTLSEALREVEKAYRYAATHDANDELLGRCSYWLGHIENEMLIKGFRQIANIGKSLIQKASLDVTCYFEGDVARWRIKHWDDSLDVAKQAAYAKSRKTGPESPIVSSPLSTGSYGPRGSSSGESMPVGETIPDFDSEHSFRSASPDQYNESLIRRTSAETNRSEFGTKLHDNGGPLSPSHPHHPYYAGPKVDTTAATAATRFGSTTQSPEDIALPDYPTTQSYRSSDPELGRFQSQSGGKPLTIESGQGSRLASDDRTLPAASTQNVIWSQPRSLDALRAAKAAKKQIAATRSASTGAIKSPRRASYVPLTPGSVYSPLQGGFISSSSPYKSPPPITPISPAVRADKAVGSSPGVFGHRAASEPLPSPAMRRPSIIQRRHSRSKSVAFDLDDGVDLTKPVSPGTLDVLRRRLSIFKAPQDVLREAEEGCSSPRLPDLKE